MGESPVMPSPQRKISRRAALASIAGLGSVAFPVAPGFAAQFDNPPVFANARHQFTMIEPAQQMPDIVLQDRRGRPARLPTLSGKVLLVNFWATWCAACQDELPLLERFQRAMDERVKVAAISTDIQCEKRKICSYLASLNIVSLPVYLSPEGQLARGTDASNAPFLISSGMPVTYLITPAGRVAGYILGTTDWMTADGQRLLSYYANA